MNTSLFVLILEDTSAIAEMLRTQIGKTFPEVMPLIARSIGEANILTYQYEFAAYIVDLSLPDGNGAEFISDVKTVLPDSNFIVITGETQEIAQGLVSHIARIPVVKKPFNLLEVMNHLSNFLPRPEADTVEFCGSLRSLRLVDLIQVKCLSLATCQIVIYSPGGQGGIIGFQTGALVHASCGDLLGREAFTEMLRWKNGSFQETDFDADLVRNIHEPWELALLEAVRRADEFNSVEVA